MSNPNLQSEQRDAAVFESWASFEGVPDWALLPAPAPATPPRAWRRGGHRVLDALGVVMPGLALAVALAFVGKIAADWIGRHALGVEGKSPVSPVLLAILLGLFVRNAFGVPKVYDAGVRWCTRTLLRLGIVLLGLGLSVVSVAKIGLVGLVAYPWLAHLIFGDHFQAAGLFLGTAIHDTAQVAGAGAMYRDQFQCAAAMDTAVTIKLVRNLSLPILIPLLAVLHRRHAAGGGAPAAWMGWRNVVPGFVAGFFLLACVRSLGDQFLSAAYDGPWRAFHAWAGDAAAWCLIISMASIGLGTAFARLRNLGLKPLLVGFAAALLVAAVSVGLIELLV